MSGAIRSTRVEQQIQQSRENRCRETEESTRPAFAERVDSTGTSRVYTS